MVPEPLVCQFVGDDRFSPGRRQARVGGEGLGFERGGKIRVDDQCPRRGERVRTEFSFQEIEDLVLSFESGGERGAGGDPAGRAIGGGHRLERAHRQRDQVRRHCGDLESMDRWIVS
ncbi:MAG: hypothetical protein ACLGHX_14295, partial [Acidimicrobiia bacterium]